MFVAMNRFKITAGSENEFVSIWKNRKTYLEEVPGFKEFHLFKGPGTDAYTLFASHTSWESRDAFEAWTRSEAFRKAHANASSNRDIYTGPPQLELFEDAL